MTTVLGPVDTAFRTALRRLDAAGRLGKVSREVSPVDEIAGIMKARDGRGPLLFENVAGHRVPVVGNLLASPADCEAAFGTDLTGLRTLTRRALAEPRPTVRAAEVPAQEVVLTGAQIDLGALLPVLRHTPGDGGRFITAGVVIARDAATGTRNASFHRLQLVGPDRTAIKLDHGRHLRRIIEQDAAAGRETAVSVCLGADLALIYAAAFMGSRMPFEADELDAAGGLRGSGLPVAAGVSQDVVVAAESEIVLEGVVRAGEQAHEGPFGEFVGYLSDEGPAPVLQVTALTHRRDPVYHAISGAGRETVMLRKYVLEAVALDALQASVPIVTDVDMTAGGLHRFHLVVQVRKEGPAHEGLQRNAIVAAFGAMKDVDCVIVVDDDIDIHDPLDVEYALATRMEASRDLLVLPGLRGHEYVRVSDHGVRAKLGVDATVPFDEAHRFRRAAFAEVSISESDVDSAPGVAALTWLNAVRSL